MREHDLSVMGPEEKDRLLTVLLRDEKRDAIDIRTAVGNARTWEERYISTLDKVHALEATLQRERAAAAEVLKHKDECVNAWTSDSFKLSDAWKQIGEMTAEMATVEKDRHAWRESAMTWQGQHSVTAAALEKMVQAMAEAQVALMEARDALIESKREAAVYLDECKRYQKEAQDLGNALRRTSDRHVQFVASLYDKINALEDKKNG